MCIHLPRRVCENVPAAIDREWLLTNGIGGFAAGTVAGALTRRYHGLLIAALHPPVGRRLLVAKLDESVTVDGRRYPLYTNVWGTGVEEPNACRWLARFDLVLGLPTWTFDLDGIRVIKRVWMEHGANATCLEYQIEPADAAATLDCRLLVNDRDYHHLARGRHRSFQVQSTGTRLTWRAADGGHPMCAAASTGRWQVAYAWCRDFHLRIEQTRGFDHREDHLALGRLVADLRSGRSVTLRLAADDLPDEHGGAAERDAGSAGAAGKPASATLQTGTNGRAKAEQRARKLLTAALGPKAAAARPPIQQLVLAADQFLVARSRPGGGDGHTIIAGYPWFTDWGRDTMISLPGLTLATGRSELAREILLTWSHYIDQGMIPNRFGDEAGHLEYHTADATLWYLWAIDQYVRATADVATLAELFPSMRAVIDWHRRGTRHNIRVGEDGLVYAGEPGVALTWMDAKIDGRVITPRIGKPVELSALWYDALCNMARLADLLEAPGGEYTALAQVTRGSFSRFWNAARHGCFDLLDGPDGDDGRVRPNQVFAVSLTHSPLTREQQGAVVKTCEKELLTWFGLRTLAPREADYRGRYDGGPVGRDEAYHQGTAWGWLMGPFTLAHFRAHHDARHARALLEPLIGQLWRGAVGNLSEIFDGDEPYEPSGCFAQAWSVAETLRAWMVTQSAAKPPRHSARAGS